MWHTIPQSFLWAPNQITVRYTSWKSQHSPHYAFPEASLPNQSVRSDTRLAMKGSMSMLCNWPRRGTENRQVPGKVWAPAGCRVGGGGSGGGRGGVEIGLVPRGGNPISERVAVKVNPCWATFHKSMRGLYRETRSHCCKQAHTDSHHPLTRTQHRERLIQCQLLQNCIFQICYWHYCREIFILLLLLSIFVIIKLF